MKFYQLTKKSFQDNKVKTLDGLWKKIKKDHAGISISMDTKFKKLKSAENKFNVIMSTAKEDRHREVIEQKWDLKNFKKNNVLLDSHNYDSIEHIIGKVNKVKVQDNKLKGEVEFMLDNPKGLLAFKMVKGGFLNATSVGFIPLEFDEKKGNVIKSELLELSAVSVPANAEALFEKKIKKIEKEVEKKEKMNKLEAIKRLAEKEELRKNEILKESLAVIQRLQSQKVDNVAKKRQMVNRVIKQLIKIK